MNWELIETLLQAAQDAREAFPEIAELDDVGDRRISTREFYGLADHLLRKRHFSKIVPAAATMTRTPVSFVKNASPATSPRRAAPRIGWASGSLRVASRASETTTREISVAQRISSLNMAPTAVAGDGQVVVLNTAASLDGLLSSDPDLDPFNYCWSIASVPIGSMAGLAGSTTATPSLTPDLAGTYVIQLIVNDGFVDSEPDTVTITAITGAAFVEIKLKDACDLAAGLASASFDAPGHRNYFCNMSSKVIHFLQTSNFDQAQVHLATMISRVDGCSLRSMPDPKGAGQPHAADFITDCEAQQQLYQLLNDASSVL